MSASFKDTVISPVYVAVSNSNVVVRSVDGISWTEHTMPSNQFTIWTSVTYGDGKFVSVTSGSLAAYSTDGITWTQTSIPSGPWSWVGFGNGKFVAVAQFSSIGAYSEDGIVWAQTALPLSAAWTSVAYGAGKFVAVRAVGSTTAYSADGITWTQSAMPASGNWWITYGNDRFVAVTANSPLRHAAHSLDGISWTLSSLPVASSSSWSTPAYGGDRFVTMANDSSLAAYSTDGITWSLSTLPVVHGWNNLTYGDGKFVAVPSINQSYAATNVSAYSTNGVNWVQTSLPVSRRWTSTVYGGLPSGQWKIASEIAARVSGLWKTAIEGYIKVNGSWVPFYFGPKNKKFISRKFFSNDGLTWKVLSTPSSPRFVRYMNGYYYGNSAVTSSNIKSINGTFWEPHNSSLIPDAYGNGRYVRYDNQSQTIKHSTDAINWSNATVPASQSGGFGYRKIEFGAGVFVATTFLPGFTGTTHIYSTNGINWQQSALPTVYNSTKIQFLNGRFIAYSDPQFGGTNYQQIFVSTNGISWTSVSLPYSARWAYLDYGSGRYVMARIDSGSSNQQFHTISSTNATSWTTNSVLSTASFSELNGLLYGDGKFIGVPFNGSQLFRSADGVSWQIHTLDSTSIPFTGNTYYLEAIYVDPDVTTSYNPM